LTTHTPTEFFQPVIDAITANPIFIQFGLGIVFIMAVIPFWPIPIEPLAVFMILAEEESLREATLWNYAITIGIGAYISMVIAFYGGRHLHRLTGSKSKRKDMTDSHWFHRYGIITLFAIPTISSFSLVKTQTISGGFFSQEFVFL